MVCGEKGGKIIAAAIGLIGLTTSHLDEFGLGHDEHTEHGLDVGALQLVQQVVEARHALLPVVQLRTGAQVIRLLPQLVALSQDLTF